jgi:hypothetical protein
MRSAPSKLDSPCGTPHRRHRAKADCHARPGNAPGGAKQKIVIESVSLARTWGVTLICPRAHIYTTNLHRPTLTTGPTREGGDGPQT